MTVTVTPRMGVTTWDSGADPFIRSQLHDSHTNIENKAAGFEEGLESARPAASTSYAGFIFYATDTDRLFYCKGGGSPAWVTIRSYGSSSTTTAIGGSAATGSAATVARSDHTHGLAGFSVTNPVTVVKGATGSTVGVGTSLSRSDHRHALAANSVTSTEIENNAVIAAKIPTGAIGSTHLAAGAVNTAALGTASITLVKLATEVTDQFAGDGHTHAALYSVLAHDHAGVYATSGHNHDATYLGIAATAANATKWATARTITLTGDVTGLSGPFDGTANLSFVTTVADDSHAHNTQYYTEAESDALITTHTGLADPHSQYSETTALTGGTIVPYRSTRADVWTTARTITLTGDVTGAVAWSGSGNVSLAAVVQNDSHTHNSQHYTEAEIDGMLNTVYSINESFGYNITMSTANPSGGATNDIWLKYV